jgi:hypothetical protein
MGSVLNKEASERRLAQLGNTQRNAAALGVSQTSGVSASLKPSRSARGLGIDPLRSENSSYKSKPKTIITNKKDPTHQNLA